VGSFHSSHGQLKRSVVANLSMLSTLRPPRFFGRHTVARLTLHCPPIVLSKVDHRNILLIRLKRIYNFLCSMLILTPFA
jgi:hypothetical protein